MDRIYRKMVWEKKMIQSSQELFLPILLFQILFLCLLCIFLVFSHGVYLRKQYSRLIVALASVGFLGFINYSNYHVQHQKRGLITKEHACMHIGPAQEFTQLTSLPIATKVSIIDHKNNWFKIRHEKQVGWMHQDFLEVI